jgi:hypothetical protein
MVIGKRKAENVGLRREGGPNPSWQPWVLGALEQERVEAEERQGGTRGEGRASGQAFGSL